MKLQLFAEGAQGTAQAAPQDAGAQTAAVSAAAPEGNTGKQTVQVIYGKAPTGAEQQPQAQEPTGATNRPSFADLLKDEGYKAEYDKSVQAAIQRRFKENSADAERQKMQNSIIGQIAGRYKLEAGADGRYDLKALQSKLDADTSGLEDEALEKGMSVQTLSQLKMLERRNAELTARQNALDAEQQQRAAFQQIVDQADQLKAKVPDIDILHEMDNEIFRQMVLPPHMGGSGVPVEQAYFAIHYAEMMQAGMEATAKTTARQIANAVKSGTARPSENGSRTAHAVEIRSDPTKFTRADYRDIRERVARGEKISF